MMLHAVQDQVILIPFGIIISVVIVVVVILRCWRVIGSFNLLEILFSVLLVLFSVLPLPPAIRMTDLDPL